MNRIGTLLIGLLLVGAPAGAGAAGFTKQDLDAQLKLFLAWHQGRYDNHSQLLRQSGGPLATPVTAPVYRLHTVYLPIDMPEFGPHVLYVEEYKNNDIAQNARIRLYSITADEKEQAVRIKIWMPLKPEPLIGSLRDLSKVKQLTKADMRMFRDVCDVWMYWTGNAFIGGMKDRSARSRAQACKLGRDRLVARARCNRGVVRTGQSASVHLQDQRVPWRRRTAGRGRQHRRTPRPGR
jgi:hypothetical protein